MTRSGVLAASIVGLVLVVFSFAPRDPEADRPWMAGATTYSPGPWGSKALFLLLDEIGLDTERLRSPAYDQLAPETVLWVLTREPFGLAERRDLVDFLRKGGTVIAPPQALAVVLEEAGLGKPRPKAQAAPLVASWGMPLDLEGAPQSLADAPTPTAVYATAGDGVPVVAAWTIGRGRAVSLGVDRLTWNKAIGRAGNGPFLARLALTLGRTHVFDEYKTGFGEGNLVTLLTHVPYRWAIAQFALLGVVGLIALARRRLPAEPPGPLRRRRTLDHVHAVAQLWEQARDGGLPLHAIMSSVAERARVRLGDARHPRPFVEWIERVRPALVSRASEAWERAERLSQQPRPPLDEARLAAADIKELEREGVKW